MIREAYYERDDFAEYSMTRQEAEGKVVIGLLKRGISILKAKTEDYSSPDDAFSNFRFTGMVLDFAVKAGVQGHNLSFLALISTKLARLIEVLGSGKQTRNEAIEDTCIDGANYFALWGGYLLTRGTECVRVGDNLTPVLVDRDTKPYAPCGEPASKCESCVYVANCSYLDKCEGETR